MEELMVLPSCSRHGEMVLRDPGRQTYEQSWCGTWYDCPICFSSVLYPSKELQSCHEPKIEKGQLLVF